MKKKIVIISVILAILVLGSITGIYLYNKSITYNITITEKIWNESGEQVHNKDLKFNIKLDDEIKVNGGLGDEITFKIIKVNKNSITIKTSEKMSENITNLLSDEDEFVIRKSEETKLNRLLTDMAVSYTIKLER